MLTRRTSELTLLAKAAEEFARKELAPGREENDKFPYGPFFDTVLDKAFRADFLHVVLPEAMDGMGQGQSALCILLEGICREDASLGGIIFTNAAAQTLMQLAGADEALQKATSKAKTAKEFLLGMPVFNNPSEIEHLAEAECREDRYFLTGALDYVVLGGIAGHVLIPARLKGKAGFAYFLVDCGAPGVLKSEPVHSLGLNACPAVDVEFKEVQGCLVGREDEGPTLCERTADRMQAAAAAMALGIMQGAFKEGFAYCHKRLQGGRPIVKWSEMKMILANMAIMAKTAEMLVARACQAMDEQEPRWKECARAAAIHVQEMACTLTTDGIQVLGGVGYMKDFGQEKRFRDAKQVQALLGLAPMKKIRYIEKLIKKC